MYVHVCVCVCICICSLSDTYLKDLQLQFHIDPLLSRLIVKKTSINNLSSLFGHVPLSVLMMKLAQECFHNIKVV